MKLAYIMIEIENHTLGLNFKIDIFAKNKSKIETDMHSRYVSKRNSD